jgi:hypothetical protein
VDLETVSFSRLKWLSFVSTLKFYHLAIGSLFMESFLFLGHVCLFESSFFLQNSFFEK